MKKLRLLLTSLIAALSFGPFLAPITATVRADVDTINCGVTGNIAGENCTVTNEGTDTVNKTIKTVIRLFQVVVGLISVFMIIFGGLKYITSQGSKDSVSSAKNTILYAVIGLVIVAIAEAIVQFVLKRFES